MEEKTIHMVLHDGNEKEMLPVTVVTGTVPLKEQEYIRREAMKLQYLDKRIHEEWEKGMRYGVEQAAARWWERRDALRDYLRLHGIREAPEKKRETEREESLSEDIGSDGMDEGMDQLTAVGISKEEKNYLRQEAAELRYIDAQLQDERHGGTPDGISFWQRMYVDRRLAMEQYMQRKGIRHVTYKHTSRNNTAQQEKGLFHAMPLPRESFVAERRHARTKRGRSRGLERTR